MRAPGATGDTGAQLVAHEVEAPADRDKIMACCRHRSSRVALCRAAYGRRARILSGERVPLSWTRYWSKRLDFKIRRERSLPKPKEPVYFDD